MPSYHAPFDLLNEFITLLLNAPSSEWGNITSGFGEETRGDLVAKIDRRIAKAERLREYLAGEKAPEKTGRQKW